MNKEEPGFTIRFPSEELLSAIKKLAENNGRSINSEILEIFKKAIYQNKSEPQTEKSALTPEQQKIIERIPGRFTQITEQIALLQSQVGDLQKDRQDLQMRLHLIEQHDPPRKKHLPFKNKNQAPGGGAASGRGEK